MSECRELSIPVKTEKSSLRSEGTRYEEGLKESKIEVAKALNAFKQKVRSISAKTRGRIICTIIAELRQYIQSWKAYFQLAEVTSPLRDSDKWIRRRLRCYHLEAMGAIRLS